MIKKCAHCGAEFTPAKNHSWQIYCSKKCSDRANYLANIEYRKAYQQRYASAHREEIKIRCLKRALSKEAHHA